MQTLLTPKEVFPIDLVQENLESINTRIENIAHDFDPGIQSYISYVSASSGKRIRPVLTLLCAGATGGIHEEHEKVGLVLELIHLATLVHDDIMDEASIRRNLATANAKWGSTLSVLLGDCLFAHALELASTMEDRLVSRCVAKTTKEVCSGEILQTQHRFDFKLSIKKYFQIIEKKTAALFEAATYLGALLNSPADDTVENLRLYGQALGVAYQIYDDCLDLVGKESKVGKTLGTDLIKGKLTLPILLLLEQASSEQKEKLQHLLLLKEPLEKEILAGIANYQGALKQALSEGKKRTGQGRQYLQNIPESPFKDKLTEVTRFLDTRLDACQSAI